VCYARDIPLDKLLTLTRQAIDKLLANLPAGLNEAGYHSDMSDTITGCKGVRVLVYSDGNTENPTKNLQVNGPEALVAILSEHYPQYEVWGRTTGHIVFHLL
jgi:hypothetical protein